MTEKSKAQAGGRIVVASPRSKEHELDTLQTYYETAFAANEQGNIYRPFTTFERLSHERRVALLANLPIPSLAQATVVDYGVGAWGIGCVFPRLKDAEVLHGIDISEKALEKTRLAHARDPSMAGKDIRLSTSTGYSLAIDDGTVDLFFAGEAIEHVDETDVFLEEVYRVMRPGALAVFTTPNATPFIYRSLGQRWCVGFEHSALMGYQDLRIALERYFAIDVAKGFNQSFHPRLDDGIDEASAQAWVDACENEPKDATGLILLARKTDDRRLPASEVQVVEGLQCPVEGTFQDMLLTPGYSGRMVESGSALLIPIPAGAQACQLVFWSHDWSGQAQISTGSQTSTIDLYHPVGGCLRHGLGVAGSRQLIVTSASARHPRSNASQIILMRAVFRI